jgi:uncharacterized protein
MAEIIDRKFLSEAVGGAVESLRSRREVINNLNVFPVPDGDTGTNFYLTMKAGFEEMEGAPGAKTGEAAKKLARGALMGSRGNSGVIFSQLLAGVAGALSDARPPGVKDLVLGIREGVGLAYKSVDKPMEGTMLTVLREVSEGLGNTDGQSISGLMREAYNLACCSLVRTPVELDVLARYGVVDAGGAGVVAVLEGIVSSLGLDERRFDWEKFGAGPLAHDYSGPRWELVFSIDCAGSDILELKKEIRSLGDSIVTAGSSPPYRVHIHTNAPRGVLEVAGEFGCASQLEVMRF